MARDRARGLPRERRACRREGRFPALRRRALPRRAQRRALDADVREAIRRHGIRNGCLTSIAPTGTISLLRRQRLVRHRAGVRLTPIRAACSRPTARRARSRSRTSPTRSIAQEFGADAALTEAFVRAGELTPREHLEMQAALQRHVDSSISKTINCPADISFEAFKDIYARCLRAGPQGLHDLSPQRGHRRGAQAADASRRAPRRPQPQRRRGRAAIACARGPCRRPACPSARATSSTCRSRSSASRCSPGYTYKIKWPESDHAIYITINDIEQDPAAPGAAPRRRPFEIFINTRNLEHYAWTVALTRMISAVFRRGGDVVVRRRGAQGRLRSAGRPLDRRPLRAEPARRHRRGHRERT